MLLQLDAEVFFVNKFAQQVKNFVSEIRGELELQIKLSLSDKKDFSKKIEALNKEKEKALSELKEKDNSAQPLDDSAQDILNDIRNAIVAKSAYLAQLVYSKNDSTAFNEEILSIIRPILLNSFKREISEYQDVVGSSVKEFFVNINDILADKDNTALNKTEDLIGNLIGKDIIEGFLKKGLEQLAARLVAYKGLSVLPKSLSRILGPLTTIVINVIPDILRLIFGKSQEQKIEDIREKIVSEIVGKIVESLRTPVTNMLEEQRKSAMAEMERIISEEIKKIDDNIMLIQQEQQTSEEEIAVKVKTIEIGINKLKSLTENI